jgi:hypothetical protein
MIQHTKLGNQLLGQRKERKMLYAKVDIITKEIVEYPLHVATVKKRLQDQNVSLPADIKSADLNTFGYYAVQADNKQPIAPAGYRSILSTPIWDGNEFIRTWAIVPIDPDFEERLWFVIRKKRTKLLKETDWTELPSVRAIHNAEWAEKWDIYRQQLRDITKIEYPTMVIFPLQPIEYRGFE